MKAISRINQQRSMLLCVVAIVVWVIIANSPCIATHIRMQRQIAQDRAKIKTLNLYMPSGKFAGRDGEINYGNIADHVDYYQKITEYFPQLAEGHEVLGICYFHRGKKEEAMRELFIATKLNPNFFWPYYNLGILYLQTNRLVESAGYFQKAMSLPPQRTLEYIYSSKVLSDLLRAIDGAPYPVKESLQEGYKRAQILLQLCQRSLQKKEPLPINVAQIPLKVF